MDRSSNPFPPLIFKKGLAGYTWMAICHYLRRLWFIAKDAWNINLKWLCHLLLEGIKCQNQEVCKILIFINTGLFLMETPLLILRKFLTCPGPDKVGIYEQIQHCSLAVLLHVRDTAVISILFYDTPHLHTSGLTHCRLLWALYACIHYNLTLVCTLFFLKAKLVFCQYICIIWSWQLCWFISCILSFRSTDKYCMSSKSLSD